MPPTSECATIETRTIYLVMSNADLEEGRGRKFVAGRYLHRAAAEKAAKGKYIWGSDCPIEVETDLSVLVCSDGTMYLIGKEIDQTNPEDNDPKAALKAQALAKLTDEERDALGVK